MKEGINYNNCKYEMERPSHCATHPHRMCRYRRDKSAETFEACSEEFRLVWSLIAYRCTSRARCTRGDIYIPRLSLGGNQDYRACPGGYIISDVLKALIV